MPDNWSYVAAAYGLTALVLGLYWRHLVRKENELANDQIAERSRKPSRPAHPRPDSTTRGPLQR
jgi:hypothetical protein